ncbi:MAG TPA: type II toxin-antitoxin system CcdA family antitoxin [Thermoanaerobaculia bacterium]|jgi:antitoxin CcdA
MKAHKLADDSHLPYDRDSSTLEDVRSLEARRKAWLAENREAIAAYNELVTQNGAFSDGLRGF